MTILAARQDTIALVAEAVAQGARQAQACQVINLSERTLQRWQVDAQQGDLRSQRVQAPSNAFTALERQRILAVANSEEFAHLPPSQIVPRLSDQGQYVGSESTINRVLKSANQLKRRGRERASQQRSKPRALSATRPNELYSWDITYLPSPIKGIYFYLYLVMDIYSRKIVGWQVYEVESAELASEVIRDICQRENIAPNQVTLHSDNGSPMKAATMLATLQDLGVAPSRSRPAVSNDNPFSEALFRTLKYRPTYPDQPFENLLAARQWVAAFTQWYNHEHRHSAIRFVTPAQRHAGLDAAILSKRAEVYKEAKQRHPNRWSRETRNWEPVTIVHLNPEQSITRKNTPETSEIPLKKAA